MADFLTPAERSVRMSRIKGRDTKPELRLRKALHGLGFRYRLHGALPGKPDLVFPRYRTVVFVHGCFWHRHKGCKVAATPKSNTSFWLAKFARNTTRDAEVEARLRDAGWRVLTVWECDVTSPLKAEAAARKLAAEIDPSRMRRDAGVQGR
nr:DNA mismatch endonuclease Vsr [Brevundimonas sp.]